jgi:hypothetical protein
LPIAGHTIAGVVVLRSRLWNGVVAVIALLPLVCCVPTALMIARPPGLSFTLAAASVGLCVAGALRALSLGVEATPDGLVVREAFYTRRLAWAELSGASLEKHSADRGVTTYLPVLRLRTGSAKPQVRVHSLSGYRAEPVRQRVDTLNELISGRRR